MKKQFKLKHGVSLPIKADIAGNEIERLKELNGGILNPEIVLKAAKPKGSILHSCFEWDDTSAAAKYRLEQARYLIRAIEVVYIGDDGEKSEPVRAFVTLIEDGICKPRSNYMAMAEVMDDKELRARYLSDTLSEYEALARRNSNIKEFANIHDAIKKARKRIKK